MISSFTLVDIPAVLGDVLKIAARQLPRTTVRFMNLGVSDAVLKVQECATEGGSYTDISGATITVKPGGEADMTVITKLGFLKVVGSGNTYGKLDIVYRGAALFGNVDMLVIGKRGFTTD